MRSACRQPPPALNPISIGSARIGYGADDWLAYATGGYAFGRVALKGTATAGGVSASLSQNATPSGWTIGGGTELALGPNWSAKLE